MGPKTRFDKEAIVEAAFQVACEDGLSGITARKVARKLRSSVAPIYVNFDSVEALADAVALRFFREAGETLEKQEGTDLFDRVGRASIAFARKYPVLVRELSLGPNPYMPSYEQTELEMIESLGDDGSMKGWSIEERKRLFLKMKVFQTGMLAMVASGQLPGWMEEDEFDGLLLETGRELRRARVMDREREES